METKTNKEYVQNALTHIAGNTDFTTNDVARHLEETLTKEQIRRALRSISYVRSTASGVYRIAGRKVT